MKNVLYIAIVAACLNALLSVVVPCALEKSSNSLLVSIRDNYAKRHESILISSIVVAIVIYMAMELTPEIMERTPNLANLF